MTLDELNAASARDFTDALGDVFEDASWVAERAAARRSFATVTALHRALFDEVRTASEERQLAFLNNHPDLAGTAARQRSMGSHSTAEQAALGLDRLDDARFARFQAMNQAYRDRFGFPFLICVRRHTRGSILRQFARRLEADPVAERAAALQEIFLITRLRVAGRVTGPGMPQVAGSLTTHVLDTAAGRPGAGIKIELFEIDETGRSLLLTAVTDADGRVLPALLPGLLGNGGPLRIGVYELHFHAGAYLAASGLPLADPPYLDLIPIRIAIAEPEAHYHAPLLLSPYAYSTYRGS